VAPLSPQDKLTLASYLETQALTVAKLHAYRPLARDDGLKKLVEAAISTHEAQVKSAQQFLQSHGTF